MTRLSLASKSKATSLSISSRLTHSPHELSCQSNPPGRTKGGEQRCQEPFARRRGRSAGSADKKVPDTFSTFVTIAWSAATIYPAILLYDLLSAEKPRGPVHSDHLWVLLVAWAVSSTVILQVFINLTRLWDRVDSLESEMALLRSKQPKGAS